MRQCHLITLESSLALIQTHLSTARCLSSTSLLPKSSIECFSLCYLASKTERLNRTGSVESKASTSFENSAKAMLQLIIILTSPPASKQSSMASSKPSNHYEPPSHLLVVSSSK